MEKKERGQLRRVGQFEMCCRNNFHGIFAVKSIFYQLLAQSEVLQSSGRACMEVARCVFAAKTSSS